MFNVVFASSNEYVPFLLIALTSFLEHNEKDFDFINVFILDNKITEKNKNKILKLTGKFSCKITFIELNIINTMDLPTIELKSTVTPMTYSRLFISSLLPDDIKKVLYLDCDSLILGSFKDLWDTDIENYYCAGVIEPGANELLKKTFWFYDVESYINGGVLLINLEKWRKDNIEQKFIDFLSANKNKFFVADQGVLNIIFNTKIKIVDPKYNLISYFQYYDYDIAKKFCGIETEYYTKEIVDDSREHPVFLHFSGNGVDVPWHNKSHKYSSDFMEYAKKTDCQDIIEYIDPPTLKFKLFFSNNNFVRIILKLIPAKIIINYTNKTKMKNLKEASKENDNSNS